LQSIESQAPFAMPTTISWVRDGVLIVAMQAEMRVYSQWGLRTPDKQDESKSISSTTATLSKHKLEHQRPTALPARLAPHALGNMVSLHVSPSHSMLDMINATGSSLSSAGKRHSSTSNMATLLKSQAKTSTGADQRVIGSTDSASQDGTVIDIVSDEGLFEAARWANPSLPQYHPRQLMELLNAGRTRRVKAILLHLLKCIRSSRSAYSVQRLMGESHGRRLSIADGNDDSTMRCVRGVHTYAHICTVAANRP
jgi:hypothetical protein